LELIFGFLISSYSRIPIKLVGLVVNVKERDCDHLGLAIIVQPMGYSGWECYDVTLSEVSDLLVLVSILGPTILSLLLFLRFLVCVGAPRKYSTKDTITCFTLHKLIYSLHMHMHVHRTIFNLNSVLLRLLFSFFLLEYNYLEHSVFVLIEKSNIF